MVARRFGWRGQGGWATFSRLMGVMYAVTFIGLAAGSQVGGVVSVILSLACAAAVVLGWAWLSLMQLQLAQEAAP